ncbi:MAG: metalloregulator ArsR/SmtB family transcription factor [Minwuiales bacterium]|nr:metalloregulator ArsR/SmtB family transcription factor [Minwuiales bacterium]
MKSHQAITALLALAQETRLAAFRLLVEQGPPGLPVGAIAERLGVNVSTLSRHLAQLERAALLRSWRRERQVFYAVDGDGTDALLLFLTEDCCKADPQSCADAESGEPGAGQSRSSAKSA